MEIDPVHPEISDSIFRISSWDWGEPRYGEHFRRCNFCGSIHPEDLAAEPVWHANWADRKYGWPHKFYVDIPNRNPGRLYAIGTSSGEDRPSANLKGWVRKSDLTDEQREVLNRDRMDSERTKWVMFDTRPHHYVKFYSMHLNDPNISDYVKNVIYRKSGLRFKFKDGKVYWYA